jgi:hypothetical protein
VAALKYDPAKVGGLAAVIMRSAFLSSRYFRSDSWCMSNGVAFFFEGQVAPQNDRVLVRLQQIPEVSPLSTAFHYCTFVLLFCFI